MSEPSRTDGRKLIWGAIVIASLVLYFVMGLVTNKGRGQEQYPFFSWFLFDRIPNKQEVYSLSIHSVGAVTFDPPLSFWKSESVFGGEHRASVDYYNAIQRLGSALERHDETRAAAERQFLEQGFSAKPASYDIVKAIQDPIVFWKTGTYEDERPVASFIAE